MGLTFRGSLKQAAKGAVAVVQMKDSGSGLLDSSYGLARIGGGDVAPRYLLKAGDLVFRSRGFQNSFSLVTPQLGVAVTIAPMMFVRIHDSAQVLPDYLHWWLNRPATQKLINERAQGGTIHMIPAGALADLPVELPPMQQQRAIANIAKLSLIEQMLAQQIDEKHRVLVDTQLYQAVSMKGASNGH
jgi:hypothetical protein